MAVVSVPGSEPWVVARWAFRLLADSASPLLTDAADKYILEQAVALDGLLFDLLDAEQAQRLASALESAATDLRLRLITGPQTDPRDAEFADVLAVLVTSLHDMTERHLEIEP
ncbi:MAG: hypothetical protein JW722_00395 [Demequinaceae bacterium]|nr:hypothetical protein [Demequinaceae bacterium]